MTPKQFVKKIYPKATVRLRQVNNDLLLWEVWEDETNIAMLAQLPNYLSNGLTEKDAWINGRKQIEYEMIEKLKI